MNDKVTETSTYDISYLLSFCFNQEHYHHLQKEERFEKSHFQEPNTMHSRRSSSFSSPITNTSLDLTESSSAVTHWTDAESRTRASTSSHDTFRKKKDHRLHAGIWSPSSLFSLSPPISPSPILSPGTFSDISSMPFVLPDQSFCNRASEIEEITPVEEEKTEVAHKSSLSFKDLALGSGEAVKQECRDKKSKQKAKSVRTYRQLLLCEPTTISSSTHEEQHTVSSSPEISSWNRRALHVDNQQEKNKGHHHSTTLLDAFQLSPERNVRAHENSEVNRVGNLNSRELAQPRERPIHDFVSGVERSYFGFSLEEWREAKSTEIINKLRYKEDAVNAWELEETSRAANNLKDIEIRLDNKLEKACTKMQKKITRTREKAEAKKERARNSTQKKISELSKKTAKIGKLPWWKSLFRNFHL